jgi:chaperonin GroEL (HSP60 family)
LWRERDSGVDDAEGAFSAFSLFVGGGIGMGRADGVGLVREQAKHAAGEFQFGVDGETGKVVDMKEYGLYESAAVKVQTIKTAIEVRFLGLSLSTWLVN